MTKANNNLTRSNHGWPRPYRAQARWAARVAPLWRPVKGFLVVSYAIAIVLTAATLTGAALRFFNSATFSKSANESVTLLLPGAAEGLHPYKIMTDASNDSAPAMVGSDAPKEGRHQDIRGGVQLGDDLAVYSAASTNSKTGAVSLTDTYTRGGMTNLIRSTRLEEGNVAARIHRLYRDGERLAIVSEVRGQLGIQTMAESAFHLDFIFHADRTIKGVGVMSADGTIVDLLTATNMVLSPISSPDLRKAQRVGADEQRLFEDVEAKSPAQFRREAQDLIEKHEE